MKTTWIVASAVLLAAGCGGQEPPPVDAPAIVGQPARMDGAWELRQLDDMPMHGGIEPPTLTVAGDSVSGFGGVNRFTGSLADEGPFLFGPLATTRMAGPPAAMELETLYLAALQQADGWRIEGDSLVLTADRQVIAVFRRPLAE